MTYDQDAQEYRDKKLSWQIRMAAEREAGDYRAWIQAELIALKVALQLLEATAVAAAGMDAVPGDAVYAEIVARLARLDDINMRELEQLNRQINERCEEVDEGGGDEFLADREYLDEVIGRYEAIVRELLMLRKFVVAQ
jgi:hypothetical protein